MRDETQNLTQVEFDDKDFDVAARVAKRLGYQQTAYTSSSALWGLFCLPENPEYAKKGEATRPGCIIKTKELGLMFVQNLEDLGLDQNGFKYQSKGHSNAKS